MNFRPNLNPERPIKVKSWFELSIDSLIEAAQNSLSEGTPAETRRGAINAVRNKLNEIRKHGSIKTGITLKQKEKLKELLEGLTHP